MNATTIQVERTFDYPWCSGYRGRGIELVKARDSAYREAFERTGAVSMRCLEERQEHVPAPRRAWGAVALRVTFTFATEATL